MNPYKRRCKVDGCMKRDQGGSLCIQHGGGRKCDISTCALFGLRTCKEHGGSKKCSMDGCTRAVNGKGLRCITHGGGNRCQIDTCDKLAQVRGLCRRHGGVRICNTPDCFAEQKRGGYCVVHRMTPPLFCMEDNCFEKALRNRKCKLHNRRLCQYDNCTLTDRGRGFCAPHGGGQRCVQEDCTLPRAGGGNCRHHGGGIRCAEPGCRAWTTGTQGSGGYCTEHVKLVQQKRKKCTVDGCVKFSQGRNRCLKHGGGRLCSVPGCERIQRRHRVCGQHGGYQLCSEVSCGKTAQLHGLCRAHAGLMRS